MWVDWRQVDISTAWTVCFAVGLFGRGWQLHTRCRTAAQRAGGVTAPWPTAVPRVQRSLPDRLLAATTPRSGLPCTVQTALLSVFTPNRGRVSQTPLLLLPVTCSKEA